MAAGHQSHHHLKKVGQEAFGLIEQHYGQSISSSHQAPPRPRSHELHHRRPYVYGGPQAVTVVQEPNAYIGPEVHTESKTAVYNYQGADAFTVRKEAPRGNGRWFVQKLVHQVPAADQEQQPVVTCQDAARIYGGIRICEHGNLRAKPHKSWDF